MTNSFELDAHTELQPLQDNRFGVDISGGWNIGLVPNGGYLMALLARAMLNATDKPDPFSITAHFQNRTQSGAAELQTETLRQGGRVGFAAAKLLQNGSETVRATGVFGDFSRQQGENLSLAEPPALDWPEKFYQLPIPLEFHKRLRFSLQPDTARRLATGGDGKTAEMIGRIKLADGRPTDVLALLLFADAFPPTLFNVYGNSGWVPTLEMTTQIRGLPAPGPVLARFASRYLSNGLVEEDGELWDSDGKLVAISRQLAMYRRNS